MTSPAKQTTIREHRRCTSVVFPTGPYGDVSATDAARIERLIATSGHHQLRLIASTKLMVMLWPTEARDPPETGAGAISKLWSKAGACPTPTNVAP